MAIYFGDGGDNSILGTAFGDDFHLEQGGSDTADGGAGVDVFYFGAAFSAGDQVVGGAGRDFLVLDGDYSGGLTFAKHQLKSISDIVLTAGNSYALGGLDHVRGALRIDGSDLGSGETLSVDGAGRAFALDLRGGAGDDLLIGGAAFNKAIGGAGSDTLAGGDAGNNFHGGDGADSLTGGTGNDTLYGDAGSDTLIGGAGGDYLFGGADGGDDSLVGGAGADTLSVGLGRHVLDAGDDNDHLVVAGALDPATVIDGGAGDDWLEFNGAGGSFTLDDAQVHSVERLIFENTTYCDVTVADDLTPADGVLQVYSFLAYNSGFRFDGSAETDAAFSMTGGFSNDTLIGGSGADTLTGGGGFDSLVGGDGDDVLVGATSNSAATWMDGGGGSDTMTGSGRGNHLTTYFVFDQLSDSAPLAPDTILNLGDDDFIYLTAIDADTTQGGDQAFVLADHFSGHAGELVLDYDSIRKVTNLQADVDGDGQADFQVVIAGKHTDFTHFAL